MFCSDDNNSFIWIIILILIFGGNSCGSSCGGCNDGCSGGCGGNSSGFGGDWIWIIIIILLLGGNGGDYFGNLFGSCSK